MYLVIMVGKFVKQVVREWCPSTTGPLLPTMTEWAGYLVRCVTAVSHYCRAHQTVCPMNTPVWTELIWDQIVCWTRLWALGYPSRTEEGLTGPRVAPTGKTGASAPHPPPPPSHTAGGWGTRLLVRSCMCCWT